MAHVPQQHHRTGPQDPTHGGLKGHEQSGTTTIDLLAPAFTNQQPEMLLPKPGLAPKEQGPLETGDLSNTPQGNHYQLSPREVAKFPAPLSSLADGLPEWESREVVGPDAATEAAGAHPITVAGTHHTVDALASGMAAPTASALPSTSTIDLATPKKTHMVPGVSSVQPYPAHLAKPGDPTKPARGRPCAITPQDEATRVKKAILKRRNVEHARKHRARKAAALEGTSTALNEMQVRFGVLCWQYVALSAERDTNVRQAKAKEISLCNDITTITTQRNTLLAENAKLNEKIRDLEMELLFTELTNCK
ncbi:hypothetical protein AMAG_16344 [Allomyces macrogynus ATCC 38327]|uniref:BZIP domain-containing protein n=1 Tax=Allomyces macrogynus (strain ATCC 38327) TaxID=578462 RepID=A0A0L0TB30_ALLM3|nr:hypothetical protein AMAG_16344 [Allomyces macrogynus ATCC 38327]|eukprot:KNE71920.1 hypothetical protein AMAG_16344 [Allomyces macrogynus ATCC 38327]